MTIIYFIIVLGILIFIHEFGHFIVAKRAGVRVETFSLGFGPKLLKVKRGETEYCISALPFGGYVKMTGQDDTDPENTAEDDPRSYVNKTFSQRLRIVTAGPAMNVLLALVLMPLVFMIGRMEPRYLSQTPVITELEAGSPAEVKGLRKGERLVAIDDQPVSDWKEALDLILLNPDQDVTLTLSEEDSIRQVTLHLGTHPNTKVGYLGVEPGLFIGNDPVIDQVISGGPAARAGLQTGDRILSLNGRPIKTWTQMAETVHASEGASLEVALSRNGQMLQVTLSPEQDRASQRWRIGVSQKLTLSNEDWVLHRYPFFGAIREGMQETWRLTGMTLGVLGRLVTFQLSYKSLGGPVRIAQASAEAAESGLSGFLFFLAFLSLQLGILNILPIPVLDGGHALFLVIEGIRKKPVSLKVRVIAQNAGVLLLFSLLLLITWNDLDSIFGFANLFERVKAFF